MSRKILLLASAFALVLGAPAFAENGSNGPRDGAKGTNGPVTSRPGGGGGVQYSIPAGQREPSRQPTGSVAGTTGVGICGCH